MRKGVRRGATPNRAHTFEGKSRHDGDLCSCATGPGPVLVAGVVGVVMLALGATALYVRRGRNRALGLTTMVGVLLAGVLALRAAGAPPASASEERFDFYKMLPLLLPKTDEDYRLQPTQYYFHLSFAYLFQRLLFSHP